MTSSLSAVGLIGLGNAGLALAGPLASHYRVIGYDLDGGRYAAAQRMGVQVAECSAEVADACEVILFSLPTPDASLAAARSLTNGNMAGRLLIETSTVAPADVFQLQSLLREHGASVMDAAIVGGVHKLAAGHTTFLVGGSDEQIRRAKSVLSVAAEEIFHLGDVGSGMRAKLVNNAVAHTTMVMLLESATLAARAGIPMDVFYKLMARESGLMRPLTHRFGERIRDQDFDGGMPTANARKDSALALEMGRELGVPLFTLQASHVVYEMARSHDLDRLDYAAISRLFESWADVEFRWKNEA